MPRVNSSYEEIKRRDEQISRNIKSHLAKKGMTAVVLAKRIGIPQSTLYDRLKNAGDIRLTELYRIAKSLGVEVQDILE
jgi:predicted transcriptional regulator